MSNTPSTGIAQSLQTTIASFDTLLTNLQTQKTRLCVTHQELSGSETVLPSNSGDSGGVTETPTAMLPRLEWYAKEIERCITDIEAVNAQINVLLFNNETTKSNVSEFPKNSRPIV